MAFASRKNCLTCAIEYARQCKQYSNAAWLFDERFRARIIAYRKDYYSRPEVKTRRREYMRDYMVRRYSKDEQFKAGLITRAVLGAKMRRHIRSRGEPSLSDVMDMAVASLGSPPDDGEDYQIDHIIPLSRFDLSDEQERKKAFSVSNLQWLPASKNRSKGNKIQQ